MAICLRTGRFLRFLPKKGLLCILAALVLPVFFACEMPLERLEAFLEGSGGIMNAITGLEFAEISPADVSVNIGARPGPNGKIPIQIVIPDGRNRTGLTLRIEHNGSSISPDPGTPMDFSIPQDFVVSSGGEGSKIYTVTVTNAVVPPQPTVLPRITGFSFPALAGITDKVSISDVDDGNGNFLIIVLLRVDTPLTSLTASITFDGVIQRQGMPWTNNTGSVTDAGVDFSGGARYEVTRAGEFRSYLVVVSMPPPPAPFPDPELQSLVFTTAQGGSLTPEIAIGRTVIPGSPPYVPVIVRLAENADIQNLKATFIYAGDSMARINPAAGGSFSDTAPGSMAEETASLDFSSPVDYQINRSTATSHPSLVFKIIASHPSSTYIQEALNKKEIAALSFRAGVTGARAEIGSPAQGMAQTGAPLTSPAALDPLAVPVTVTLPPGCNTENLSASNVISNINFYGSSLEILESAWGTYTQGDSLHWEYWPPRLSRYFRVIAQNGSYRYYKITLEVDCGISEFKLNNIVGAINHAQDGASAANPVIITINMPMALGTVTADMKFNGESIIKNSGGVNAVLGSARGSNIAVSHSETYTVFESNAVAYRITSITGKEKYYKAAVNRVTSLSTGCEITGYALSGITGYSYRVGPGTGAYIPLYITVPAGTASFSPWAAQIDYSPGASLAVSGGGTLDGGGASTAANPAAHNGGVFSPGPGGDTGITYTVTAAAGGSNYKNYRVYVLTSAPPVINTFEVRKADDSALGNCVVSINPGPGLGAAYTSPVPVYITLPRATPQPIIDNLKIKIGATTGAKVYRESTLPAFDTAADFQSAWRLAANLNNGGGGTVFKVLGADNVSAAYYRIFVNAPDPDHTSVTSFVLSYNGGSWPGVIDRLPNSSDGKITVTVNVPSIHAPANLGSLTASIGYNGVSLERLTAPAGIITGGNPGADTGGFANTVEYKVYDSAGIYQIFKIVIVPANTFYVADNGSDSNNGGETAPFRTIKKAIDSGGSIIMVKGELTRGSGDGDADSCFKIDTGSLSREITVTGVPYNGQQPALVGPGKNSTGSNRRRVLNILGTGRVRLENITVKEGHTTGKGGGIWLSEGGKLVAVNVTLQNNKAVYYGGGIFIEDNGELIFRGGSIKDNDAAYGGGLDSHGVNVALSKLVVSGNTASTNGGGIHIDQGTCSLSGCEIKNNTAGNGGGILTKQSFRVEADPDNWDTVISNNNAVNGGGVYVYSSTAAFDLHTGSIINNTATGSGGGVYLSGTVKLRKGSPAPSVIQGNTAPNGSQIRMGSTNANSPITAAGLFP